MNRRELMLLLLGGAMTAARALRAQQKAMPVIGFLNGRSPGHNRPTRATLSTGCAPAPGGTARARNTSAKAPTTEGRFIR